MASLAAYFGSHSGDLAIYVGPFSVGTGRFTTFGDFLAVFTGSYDFLGQHGTIAIGIKLSDQASGESSGTCEITLNKETDAAATYSVKGHKITFKTKLNATAVDIYQYKEGTQIDHVSGHNLWIGVG